jgi:two-component system response regulator AtoC
MQAVLSHDWPGNVRELRTAIEHGVVMASGAKINLKDLPAAVRNSGRGGTPGAAPLSSAVWTGREERFNLHRLEDRAISQALAEVKGNVTQAAKRLGISRRTLHRRIKAAGAE